MILRQYLRPLLLSLLVIGAIGALAGGPVTFSSFNAQTSNPSNSFSNGTILMKNVAGTVVSGSNCSAGTANGVCATLFNLSGLMPGSTDSSNTITISYTGTLTTSRFVLYASGYSSKGAGSAGVCTAANPGSLLDLQIAAGATIIYPTSGTGYGTLDDFAVTYAGSGSGLALKGGTNGSGSAGVWATNDSAVYTIKVHLDAGADNSYQGCQSSATLNWFAQ